MFKQNKKKRGCSTTEIKFFIIRNQFSCCQMHTSQIHAVYYIQHDQNKSHNE